MASSPDSVRDPGPEAVSRADTVPGPPGLPLLGNLLSIDPAQPLASFVRLAQAHGGLVRVKLPGQEIVFAGSHRYVGEVCDEARFEKVVAGPLLNFRDFAGDGLFTAHGWEPDWSLAHRILMPAFGPAAVANYFEPMLDIAQQMFDKWERQGPQTAIDVCDNLTRLTLDTIGLCGFGYRFNSFYQNEMHDFIGAMLRLLVEGGARARRVPLQNQLMFRTRQRYEQDRQQLFAFADKIIQETRLAKDLHQRKDLVSLMLTGKDPKSGEMLSADNIRYQAITFLIAGHETTSGLISFALAALLNHPEALRKAVNEVDRVLGPDPRKLPTLGQIRELRYVDQVLREALRLWPPAPGFMVAPKEDTTLAGRFALRKNEPVVVLSQLLHRDPAVWGADPEAFQPDHFAAEASARRPKHAWKPFGNGMRSCIGSQFAMQEAQLVLGMFLQRFEFAEGTHYRLQVKEAMSIKPDNFMVRLRRRPLREASPANGPAEDFATATAMRTSQKPQEGAADLDPASSRGNGDVGTGASRPVRIFFGSNAGSAEAFARRLASRLRGRGFRPEVASLDEGVGRFAKGVPVIVMTASYNGKPPGNAEKFCRWLDALEPGALAGVPYAVLGCGHRDWSATYQAVPRLVEGLLERAGAEPLCSRGEADAGGDFLGDFEAWSSLAETSLMSGLRGPVEGAGGTEVRVPPFVVERVDAAVDALAARYGTFPALVVESRELVNMASPLARSKWHVALALPEGMPYEAGDHLLVLPENPPALVERAARRMGLPTDAVVVLNERKSGGGASPGGCLAHEEPLPLGSPVAIRDLLGSRVELSQPASRHAIATMAAHTGCPPHRAALEALVQNDAVYTQEVLERRLSVLELLEEYPAIQLSFEEFLELLPPMQVRRYSISSSPLVDPRRVTLTVAVVDGPSRSGRGAFGNRVVASVPAGGGDEFAVCRGRSSPNVPFALRRPGARDPRGGRVGNRPVAGVFGRARLLEEPKVHLGAALLFFGCDHPDVDFLYRSELEAWERAGVVTVYPAFSQAPKDDVAFVQHRLWKEKADVGALLARGAHVYVCGDGLAMEPAVRETLGRIWAATAAAPAGGADGAAGGSWEGLGRYHTDIFAS